VKPDEKERVTGSIGTTTVERDASGAEGDLYICFPPGRVLAAVGSHMFFKCHSRRFGALIGRSRYRSQALDINGTAGCQNDRFSIEAGACCIFISELEPDVTVGPS
jgi:hypothetical protein